MRARSFVASFRRGLVSTTIAAGIAAVAVACSSSGGQAGEQRADAQDDGPSSLDGGSSDAVVTIREGSADDTGGRLPTPPSVQLIGRFDEQDALGPRAAWPGARIVARFDGTGVSVTLTQTPGVVGGPSYFNVLVDGAQKSTIAVTGTQTFPLATGLAPGVHTVELEKRNAAAYGMVRFDGFVFTGGAGLVAPLARSTRRIELLGDSFTDGLGIDGDVNDPAKCSAAGTAPPQYDDARKSVAAVAARSLSADLHLMGASGKGLARNADGTTTETFPVVYQRTLPDVADGGAWAFSSYVPDVVLIALGAEDFDGAGLPAGFQTTYNLLVTELHARYGATTPLVLTVWSQHKASNNLRQAIESAIDAVIAGRPNADKPYNSKLVFPEATAADETGCLRRGSAAHHAAMGALLASELKTRLGWK